MDQTAIIGHQSICRFLENALAKQAESHAYLFLGQALVGKGTVARWFADKILGGAKAGRNFARAPVREPLTSFGFGTVRGFAPQNLKNRRSHGCKPVGLHL